MTNAQRWMILGDSIQAAVYAAAGQPAAAATCLTASQLPGLANVLIQNLSSPGMRITQGGEPGTGAYANKNVIGLVAGYAGATGLIITLGTNDWGNPPTTGSEFSSNYQDILQYAKGLGLKLVCVSPIFRAEEVQARQHVDGMYSLGNFRTTVEGNAALAGVSYINGGEFTGYEHPEWYADGLHLNAEGHRAFVMWLVGKMRALGFWG